MATPQELAVFEKLLAGEVVEPTELEEVDDPAFVKLVLERYMKDGFSYISRYFASEKLAAPVAEILQRRFEGKLPETYGYDGAIRALDAEQKLTLLKIFPNDFARLHVGLDRDVVLDYVRKAIKTDEGAETIRPFLRGITYTFGNDAEIVERMFEYTQELSWICAHDEDAVKFGHLFDTDEQVKKTFESESLNKINHLAVMVFTSSSIIPRWLVRNAFEDASFETFNAYRKALKGNPAAADIIEELNAASVAANPFPGRPDIEKVEKLKALRALARKNSSYHSALEMLELDALAYERPYNLKLKALERAKAQEASGELSDPFKVVELEALIERVEAFMVLRAVNEYLFEHEV